MKTEILNYNEPHALNRAAEVLLEGNVVAIPTETVYGLAADASNPIALKKIFDAKGRPSNRPLIVHIQNVEELSKWAINIPEQAYQLASAFWPGPLTIVLEKAPWVPYEVTGGQKTIAIRIPAHPVMQSILKLSGLGLAAPSANLYQKISTTTAEHVYANLAGRISLIVDGGPCALGIESTILDITQIQPRVLRAGPLTVKDIATVLTQDIDMPLEHNFSISGNKKSHYKPNTRLYLMSAEAIKTNLPSNKNKVGIFCYSSFLHDDILALKSKTAFSSSRILVNKLPQEKTHYAELMYKTLFELDAAGLDAIWVECPPTTEEWLDVNDRLKRASHSIIN